MRTHSLQKTSFDVFFDLTAGVCFIFIVVYQV